MNDYGNNMQNINIEPEAFKGHNLRPEYRAALTGDLTGLKNPVAYELNGGGQVTIYRAEDEPVYSAVIRLDGVYPKKGKIALNKGRTEKINVLEGQFEIHIDVKKHALNAGDSILIAEGNRYRITGSGTCFTLVYDNKDGQTEILDDTG